MTEEKNSFSNSIPSSEDGASSTSGESRGTGGSVLVECPRDAMQGWPHFIPTAKKIGYINALLQVGFHTIDFGSFVSPKAIPQMADTAEVLQGLDMTVTVTKLLAIVANTRGAEEAVLQQAITYLGFPFSVSPTFALRNTASSLEDSFERVAAIQNMCLQHGKELVIYMSMGFGNPYGDPYNEDILLDWTSRIAGLGIRTISLADTVGLAQPAQIKQALQTLIPQYPEITFGVHLHSAAANRAPKAEAAYGAGCRRFDGALKGYGGCPMANDELIGNMATEWLTGWLEDRGEALHLNGEALAQSLMLANEIFV